MCCYFKTAATEFNPHDTEAKPAGWCMVKDTVIGAGGGGSKGYAGDVSPHQPFSNMFLINTIFP